MTYRLLKRANVGGMRLALIAYHHVSLQQRPSHYMVVRSPKPIIMSDRGLERVRAYRKGGGRWGSVNDLAARISTKRCAFQAFRRALRRWRRRVGV